MSIRLNDAANGAGGAATVPGQVAEFAAGAVPADGWRQIDGPEALQNMRPADTLVRHLHNGSSLAPDSLHRALIRNGSRLYWQLWSTSSAFTLQEVTAEHEPVGPAWSVSTQVASTASSSTRLTPLRDGTFLRFGGRSTSSQAATALVTRFNANRSTSALLDAPLHLTGAAGQAGDGKVYGMAANSLLQLVAFDPTANSYDAQNYAVPFEADSIEPLPDGNLLLVQTRSTGGRFCVFNIASKETTTPVLFDCTSNARFGGIVLTDGRAAALVNTAVAGKTQRTLVLFDPYGIAASVAVPLRAATAEAQLQQNPHNARLTFCEPGEPAVRAYVYELLMDYAPRGTARAVKL